MTIKSTLQMNDAQALSFVQGESFKVNQRVYETKFPDWDIGRLIYVDTSGPEWSPGTITYTSSLTGRAEYQSGYAKDIPLADVSQARELQVNHLAAIGYQYNIEEVNTALQVGGSLPDRRARAARLAATKFVYDAGIAGHAEKGKQGLINLSGVTTAIAANGAAGSPLWVNAAGVGQKTPAEIVADINRALQGINLSTFETEMADTILLPPEALNYIAATPYSATTMETILSFVQRTNLYTLQTGRPLTIRSIRELSTAAVTGAAAGDGRMVAYKNDQDYVKLNLPMPHRFLPVYQDSPLNWTVPGIMRIGGVELLTTAAFRYLDGISEAPTPA